MSLPVCAYTCLTPIQDSGYKSLKSKCSFSDFENRKYIYHVFICNSIQTASRRTTLVPLYTAYVCRYIQIHQHWLNCRQTTRGSQSIIAVVPKHHRRTPRLLIPGDIVRGVYQFVHVHISPDTQLLLRKFEIGVHFLGPRISHVHIQCFQL